MSDQALHVARLGSDEEVDVLGGAHDAARRHRHGADEDVADAFTFHRPQQRPCLLEAHPPIVRSMICR
jgi:hypothetical protein